MRKGELSMEVIIIAAIALLVLVILTILIVRKSVDLDRGTSCTSPSIGGHCEASATGCQVGEIPGSNSCPSDTPVCCTPLKK